MDTKQSTQYFEQNLVTKSYQIFIVSVSMGILLLPGVLPTTVSAAPAAPNPECVMVGMVVENKSTSRTEKMGDRNLTPAKVSIKKVELSSDNRHDYSVTDCVIRPGKNARILVKGDTDFDKGDVISGDAHHEGDEDFHGVIVRNLKVHEREKPDVRLPFFGFFFELLNTIFN